MYFVKIGFTKILFSIIDDRNRVILEREHGSRGSDYVNASFIDVREDDIEFRMIYFPAMMIIRSSGKDVLLCRLLNGFTK